MKIYYGGAEVPSHRTLLAEEGIENVSLSFMGLRRRTKLTKPFLLEEKFPADQNIFVDSGAYTLNKAEDDAYTQQELLDLANSYMAFVAQNLDRLHMVSEFDSLSLGREWIEAVREDFFDDLPENKFLPIWHPEFGLNYLDDLAQRYLRVGVPKTALDGRNIVPYLNGLVQKYGTKLHGIAATKPDEMRTVKWDSVASTSWLSPAMYGDTQVWVGNELKRYPVKYKDQARKRHRTLFEANGFDAEAIEDDNPKEVLRLALWSWRQLEAQLAKRKNEVVTTVPISPDSSNAEFPPGPVDIQLGETRNNVVTTVVRKDRDLKTIPVMGFTTRTDTFTDENGDEQTEEIALFNTRSSSLRMCDSCFLAAKCPAFEEGSNCAYDIPVQIKTKDQMKALHDGIIEMQAQRVLFMKMAEDLEGGYADPNLSGELDRLNKMIAQKHDMEQDGFSFKFEAKGTGKPGVLSQLFGKDVGEQAKQLPQKIDADTYIQQTGVIDAEIVDVPRREN